ncbi:MAG: hypothetical protein LBG60_16220 [Bifidobacteriaceae bacterium]|jgi:hypothetical protein|nr:hypothetical protein [Bifidobacteriaceae bacterium]
MRRPLGRLRAARAAYSATELALPTDPPDQIPDRWRRVNYRGRTVDLRGGPALAGGVLAAADRSGADSASQFGALAAIGLAAAAGALDDLKGDGSARGLRGHLKRLRQGQITTGLVKLVAVGAGAAVFAALERPAGAGADRRPAAARLGQAAVDTVLVAGAANLVNLLDLRPGRALKAVGAAAAVLALGRGGGGRMAAGLVGAVAAAAASDLGERTMLGDCGANGLGAGLGVAMVRGLPRPGRALAAAAITALILASEKISFSRVIAANPTLRRLDEWGRPSEPPGASGSGRFGSSRSGSGESGRTG